MKKWQWATAAAVIAAAAVGAAALIAGKIRPRGSTALIVSGRNIGREALARIAADQPITLGGRAISG